jgi:hypothetical protein
MSNGCYYLSISGQAFGWTQMVPTIVTLMLSAITAVSGEIVFFLFALYLYIPQYIVWVFQYYFQQVRPDPICQLYHTYAFPSTESMYIGAILGAFVSFAATWQVYHSWFVWLCLYLFALVPPLVLVYTQYNQWWEVLFSMVFGGFAGVMFTAVMRNFFRPKAAYLRVHFPFYTMGYQDTILCEEKSIEILESLEKVS